MEQGIYLADLGRMRPGSLALGRCRQVRSPRLPFSGAGWRRIAVDGGLCYVKRRPTGLPSLPGAVCELVSVLVQPLLFLSFKLENAGRSVRM